MIIIIILGNVFIHFFLTYLLNNAILDTMFAQYFLNCTLFCFYIVKYFVIYFFPINLFV